jgi:hypothetical protein
VNVCRSLVGVSTLVLASALAPHAALADPGNTCLKYPNVFDCDGTDPVRTGCDVGAVAVTAPVNYYDPGSGRPTGGSAGTVYNWYSPTCGTNWSEFRTYNGKVLGLAAVGVRTADGTGSEEYQDYGWDIWSNQVYARTSLATAWAQVTGPAAGSVTR